MPEYSKGKIYGLYHGSQLIYIGSTCTPLSARMAKHRFAQKNSQTPLYKYWRENECDLTIELIEECPCETKEQLNRREGQLIREHKPSCNKCIAGRTKSEYMTGEDGYNRRYYQKNKEVELARTRAYRAYKKYLKLKCNVAKTQKTVSPLAS